MRNKQEWNQAVPLMQPEEDAARTQRIQKQVIQQLSQTAEREETMKQKPVLRKGIRPLIFVAAILGIGAASLVTANAATDGALFEKVTVYINGEKCEMDARVVEEEEDHVTYEVVVDDGNSDGEIHEFMMEFEDEPE